MPLAIPDEPDGLTPQWLTAALREGGTLDAGTVTSASAQQINAGQGFAGRVYRLALTYAGDDAAAASMIAKLPVADADVRAMLDVIGLYRNEASFYTELAGDVGIRVPRHYYIGQDTEASRYILLLEDLAPATIGDSVSGLDVPVAERVLELLASMHARWWNSERLAQFDWLYPPSASARLVQHQLASTWASFPAEMRREIDGDAAAVIDALAPRWAQVAEQLSEPPWTLAHGDFRADNLALATDEDRSVIVFDWQVASRSRGAADVAYFLPSIGAGGSTPAARDVLLRHFHEALLAHGVTDYPRECLQEDARLGALWSFVVVVIAMGKLDFSTARARARLAGLRGPLAGGERTPAERVAGARLPRLNAGPPHPPRPLNPSGVGGTPDAQRATPKDDRYVSAGEER